MTQLTSPLEGLTKDQLLALKAMRDAGVKTPTQQLNALQAGQLDVVQHGEQHFYIPETGLPIVYQPFQKIVLKIMAGQHSYPPLLPFYSTVEYSTVKKSGKTAVSGAYARWRAESPTLSDEILFFANDETQSRGRGYEAMLKSIKLSPGWDEKKRVLLDKDGNIVWRILDDFFEHVPTQTRVRAVNVDYRGEAGANPTLSVWTECWGYDTEKQLLLFDEMTDVLTRERSQRLLEGYAGYSGKSIVQEKIEDLLTKEDKGGRQLTLDDIPDWPWQDEPEGLLPMWVNDMAGCFGYLDRGPRARLRMPWLVGEKGDAYYQRQALTLNDPQQFERLHNNYWISPTDAFIPIQWWDACSDGQLEPLQEWRSPLYIRECPNVMDRLEQGSDLMLLLQSNNIVVQLGTPLIELFCKPWNWVVLGNAEPIVLGYDASVVGDCTALVGVSRHPGPGRHQDAALRLAWKWDPPKGNKIDYDFTPNQYTGLAPTQQIIDTCMRYNVSQLAYDDWQSHHLTNQLRRASVVWCRSFQQGRERDIADKQLYDIIKLRRIAYTTSEVDAKICQADIRRHLANASRTTKAKEDTKLHITKGPDGSAKIDLVVALSMACAETLRLDL